MASVLSQKAGLFVPSLDSAIDFGVLEADENGLVFRGKKQTQLVISPVTRVWTDTLIAHVEYGDGHSIGFADYSQGAFKAPKRVKPFAQEIRAVLGLPEESPATEEQRMQDATRAAIPKGKNKMQMAMMWMAVGGVSFFAGLIWLLAAEDAGSFAWLLLVVGALRFLGGVFDYRDGKKMAAGEWRPLSEERQAKVRNVVLLGGGLAMAFVLWMVVYGVNNDLMPLGFGIAIGIIAVGMMVVMIIALVRGARKDAAEDAASATPPPPPIPLQDTSAVEEAPAVEPPPPFEPPPPAAPPEAEPPAEPVPAGVSRKAPRNRTFLFVIAGVIAVVAVAAVAYALGRRGTPSEDAKPADTTAVEQPAEQAPSPVTTPETAAPSSNALPEDVVTTLYKALADGDEQAARATFATGFDIDAGELSEWGKPQYEIETVTAGSTEGEIKVQVKETGGGLSDGDVVTWTLREESSGWRVCGWFFGAITEDPNFGADAAPPATQLSSAENEAVNIVGTFLSHRMAGAVGDMKSLATARIQKNQPELFEMQFGEFTAYGIVNVRAEDGGYVVEARETWGSSERTQQYVVVEQDGKMLVDEQR